MLGNTPEPRLGVMALWAFGLPFAGAALAVVAPTLGALDVLDPTAAGSVRALPIGAPGALRGFCAAEAQV